MENRIRELRSTKKMTQEELAIQCQVSRQTIISLERGKYDPSIMLAHKIASLFHTSIEKVFVFEDSIREHR